MPKPGFARSRQRPSADRVVAGLAALLASTGAVAQKSCVPTHCRRRDPRLADRGRGRPGARPGGHRGSPARRLSFVPHRSVSGREISGHTRAGPVGGRIAFVGGSAEAANGRPHPLNPETIMPAYYRVEGLTRVGHAWRGKPILTAQQIEDVIAFLVTLRDWWGAAELCTARCVNSPSPPLGAERAGVRWGEPPAARPRGTTHLTLPIAIARVPSLSPRKRAERATYRPPAAGSCRRPPAWESPRSSPRPARRKRRWRRRSAS